MNSDDHRPFELQDALSELINRSAGHMDVAALRRFEQATDEALALAQGAADTIDALGMHLLYEKSRAPIDKVSSHDSPTQVALLCQYMARTMRLVGGLATIGSVAAAELARRGEAPV